MDRVQTLMLLLLAAGCGDDEPARGVAPTRVEAVQARESTRTPAELCDVLHAPAEAPRFAMPELAESVPMAEGKWHWVNVWATWCQPCVEEIPTLVEWEERLTRGGKQVDLVMVSADSDAEAIASFRERVPTLPESARVADPDGVESWLHGLGLQGGATLPIQVFVDPQGRARCIRAGAVHDDDYAAVETLVGGS